MMTDDMRLVREYARGGSQEAFATLVARHVNLVYSVALRQTRDPSLTDEITQAVFIVLARKAKSLSPKTILSGWLCRTARFISSDSMKAQRRRRFREQEAYVQSNLSEPESEAWIQLAPALDDALGCLGQKEHDAIMLRFFEGKNWQQVGAGLGMGEDAARMRVNRGLEKLRRVFSKRGLAFSTATLAGALAANSVQAAPIGLAASATAAAVKGASVAATTLSLVTGALKVMTWSKMQTAVAFAAVACCAAVAVAVMQSAEVTRGYTVQGFVDFKEARFSAENGLYYETTPIDFEAQVLGGKWWMRLGTRDPKLYDYRIVSCEDRNVFLLLSYETRMRLAREEQGPSDARKLPTNVGGGGVTTGTLPRFLFAEEAGAIWLAYASWSDFRAATPGAKHQVPFANYLRHGPIMPGDPPAAEDAFWELGEDTPHLPKSVDYFVTNVPPEAGDASRTGSAASYRLTNVTFRVVSFLDRDGWRFPRESVACLYRLDKNGRAEGGLELGEEMRIVATNIAFGTSLQSFKPELPGQTIILDERFNQGSGLSLSYFATNGWPSEAAVRRSPAYRAAMYRAALADLNAPKLRAAFGRAIPALLFGTLLLLAVVLWLAVRARRRASTRTKPPPSSV
ncbi:MAG: sigma-70 family RNA polymerase sigma factor [Verrucomicrobiota bacterium]|jgi:RNA polymerase sigma factor (sigma-70 family)